MKEKSDLILLNTIDSTSSKITDQASTSSSADFFEYAFGEYELAIDHGGLTRYYRAYVPKSYDKNKKTPLVIYVHGGGGSSASSKNDGLYSYSDKYGFILLSPAGTGVLKNMLLVWNYGPYLIGENIVNRPNYATEHNIDDIGFFSKMIDDAESKFNIDKNKIYMTGISQGGMMSYRSACELSNRITAVAPVAPPASLANCNPSRPVPIMHIHGTADPCAPYNGGISEGCLGAKKELFQSAQEMINSWLNTNSCLSKSSVAYQKGNATCIIYEQCGDDAEVEFCTIEGGGHTWPSGNQYLPKSKIGPVSYDISFDQIWEFFQKYSMSDI